MADAHSRSARRRYRRQLSWQRRIVSLLREVAWGAHRHRLRDNAEISRNRTWGACALAGLGKRPDFAIDPGVLSRQNVEFCRFVGPLFMSITGSGTRSGGFVWLRRRAGAHPALWRQRRVVAASQAAAGTGLFAGAAVRPKGIPYLAQAATLLNAPEHRR